MAPRARRRGEVPHARRRRTGYRQGQLSKELRDAIAAEALAATEPEHPLRTIDNVGDVYAALDDALEPLALARLRAVAQLRRDGWSYDRIAAATSLSKGRVQQLSNAARERGL